MEIVKFDRPPEKTNEEHVIEVLEQALVRARNGEIVLAVLVTSTEDYGISVDCVVDSPLEVAGLLNAAAQFTT